MLKTLTRNLNKRVQVHLIYVSHVTFSQHVIRQGAQRALYESFQMDTALYKLAIS